MKINKTKKNKNNLKLKFRMILNKKNNKKLLPMIVPLIKIISFKYDFYNYRII